MHIRVALGFLKVQNAKTIENQWFFNDFINLERLSLKQLEMKGFEKSPDILTVIVWCMAFCYEAARRYNSLQRFCCDRFMVFYLHLKCRLNKFKVDLRSGSTELVREGRSPEARWRSQ